VRAAVLIEVAGKSKGVAGDLTGIDLAVPAANENARVVEEAEEIVLVPGLIPGRAGGGTQERSR
jgi:hypothetical protein